jgi:dolichol-phosphate mannosyltransferase
MKVSIILPTYNEAGNIGQLIKDITKIFRLTKYKLEIIVIDDNSPDGTSQAIKNLPVKLIIRKNQRGLATAILKGIQQSSGKIIVLMDTDFNHQPKDIPRLIKPIVAKSADLVIGSRYVPHGGMHISEANKLQFSLSKYGNYFVNRILLKLPVHESLSGFVAFNKKVLANLDLKEIFKGYGEYCIRLLHYVHQQNFSLTEIPVVYAKRRYGQSKSNLFKMVINYTITALRLKKAL